MAHRSTLGLLVTLILSVALAATAWAHRLPAAPAAPGWAAYLSAGGEAAGICSGGPGPTRDGAGCDACRLIAGAALPPPPVTGAGIVPPATSHGPKTAAALVAAPACHPGWTGRAPPAA
jgi:hypothetical protein